MPTLVPSSFSSTMSEASAMKSRDSCWPRCLSSSVPREPNRCGVRGYFMKSSRDAPIRETVPDTFDIHQRVVRGQASQGISYLLHGHSLPQPLCPQQPSPPVLAVPDLHMRSTKPGHEVRN